MAMPELMGALGGGAPPDAGPPLDAGPPPDEAPPDQGPADAYETSLDALDGAEEALHAFIQLDPDEADRAVAATCLQNVLKLKAKNQQEQAGGGGMTSLARALQGAGPA